MERMFAGPPKNPDRGEETYRAKGEHAREGGFTWPHRIAVDLENLARDAFGRVDDIFDNAINEDGHGSLNNSDDEDEDEWNEENLQDLVRKSSENVFEDNALNRLQMQHSFIFVV